MCSCPGPTRIQTSTVLLTVRFVGPCLCQWWMYSLGGCLPYAEGTSAPSAHFWRQQREVFASSVTHNLSLLTWYNLDFSQIDQGHGITCEVKWPKPVPFTWKIQGMRTQWPVRRANPSGNLINFIRYGMNIFGWPQKKANLLSLPLSVENKGSKKLDFMTIP